MNPYVTSPLRHARALVAAVLVGAIFVISHSTFALGADPAPLQPPVKIRINHAGLAGEAPLYMALDKGYFKNQGLEVEMILSSANSASDTLTQINSGGLDMASFALSAGWLNAVERGLGVVSLLAMNTITPQDKAAGIIVRQDLLEAGRYKEPKDLKAMKIAAFSLSGVGHYNILRAARLGELQPGDIDLVTLGPPDILAALANKSIDAAFNVEPFILIAKNRAMASMVVPDGQTSAGTPSIVVHVNSAFAGKNKEAVQRFVIALLRAQREYVAAVETGKGKGDVLNALRAHTSLKEMTMLEAINLPAADPNGRFDPAAFETQQRFFVETGAMKKTVDIRKIFDFSYLDTALGQLAAR